MVCSSGSTVRSIRSPRKGVVPVGGHVEADVLGLLPERDDHGPLAPARDARVLVLGDRKGDAGGGDALLVVVDDALGERVVGERGPAARAAAARGGEQEQGCDSGTPQSERHAWVCSAGPRARQGAPAPSGPR